MQAIKLMLMTEWQLFETEMVKYKYIHSILQQHKFNNINIFGFDIDWCSCHSLKFRILEAPLMDGKCVYQNMDSTNMEKMDYF